MRAQLLDGQSSQEQPVVLSFGVKGLQIRGATYDFFVAFADLKAQERFKNTPRRIRLPAGQELVIPLESDERFMRMIHPGFGSELHSAYRPPSISRALIYLFSVLLIAYYAYALALPLLSKFIANRLPDKILAPLGREVLATLDKFLLGPSELSAKQREMTSAALKDLESVLPEASKNRFTLEFRAGKHIGTNAMALPGGIVLVTDEIVTLAGSKERIMSILAHELGHHVYKHMLQKLVQGSLIGVVLAMMGGDVASLTTGVATTLLEARYSQDLETQADDFAADLLTKLQLKPSLLGDMLSAMDNAPENEEAGFESYISSHPATAERVARLKELSE